MREERKKHLIGATAAVHIVPGGRNDSLEVTSSRGMGLVYISGNDPKAVLSCAEQLLWARCGLKMITGMEPGPSGGYKYAITLSRIR